MTKNEITLREHLSRAGKASAAKLTPQQRSDRARKAVQAREAKRAAAKQNLKDRAA
jgi:uncharacterized protein YaiL (DUF2058 family)